MLYTPVCHISRPQQRRAVGLLLSAVRTGDIDRQRRARPSMSFVDNTIDLPWRTFLRSELGTDFQKEVSSGSILISGVTRISLQHTVGVANRPE